MKNKTEYEFELNGEYKSLTRIQEFFSLLWNMQKVQREDSFEGIEGGASPHHKIKIQVTEEWI